jgi:hypothetical protein
MLGISFFNLEDISFYSITKNDLRDVIYFYNVSDRYFLIYIDSLDSKKNSGFLRLRVYHVIVL